MIRHRDWLDSAVRGIAAVGNATARSISESDWRVAAGVGVLLGVSSTLIVIVFSPPPVGIALWLALFVVLALIGFQSAPVLERRGTPEAASLAVPRTVVDTAGDALIEMVALPGGDPPD